MTKIIETAGRVMRWHKRTFPDVDFEGQHSKWLEELWEFKAVYTRFSRRSRWFVRKKVPSYRKKEALLEIADMYIVAIGMFRYSTITAIRMLIRIFLMTAVSFTLKEVICGIEDKLIINKRRTWYKKKGVYKHSNLF